MTVLDYGQRYLRLDEANGQETINVADGVTFVATANIGNEYTSTRVMDKALMDRFTIVEMDVLSEDDEYSLLTYMFPHVDGAVLLNVAKIASLTRNESKSDTARIGSGVSTRTTVELSGLLYDGFSLQEASEVCIYPQYDSAGGVDSERTFVKQIVQKFCDDGSSDLTSAISENLGAIVIKHEKNLGYGSAIKSIFLKAKNLDCDVLVTFDAAFPIPVPA